MHVQKIRELVKLVHEFDIGEIQVKSWWGKKVTIKKNGSLRVDKRPVSAPNTAPVVLEPEQPSVAPESKPVPPPEKVREEDEKLIKINSPMVGTYYSSPAPDADPYINEGDKISPGKVLCIIEAMKLMNEIEAEISGRIEKILVENSQPVEYNQPLFLVKPD
ncbi:acetyl-CoA carboxylase biotin carboxyl carrier protein [candidate division KSB1 bacterium]|nr:acetyl-CoA carboxylase biotin carboxyl carrier protein [candidate division KSB1 bacterium]